jgi:hypothetical protein
MDGERFDRLARRMADVRSRRGLIGGAIGASALLGSQPALACKRVGRKCDKNKDCCAGAKCTGGKKEKCRCKSGFTTCNKTCCPASSQECVGGICVTPPGGCPPGADFCSEIVITPCGGDPNCICSRSTEGATLCGDTETENAVCGQCQSSADCASFGPGAFCVRTVLPCCGPDAQNVCRLPCSA